MEYMLQISFGIALILALGVIVSLNAYFKKRGENHALLEDVHALTDEIERTKDIWSMYSIN